MTQIDLPRRTVVIVGGALFSPEGKLLILQRRETAAAPAEWELPGGRLEFGESPELGLVRSFSEKIGLDISVDRPLGAWSALKDAGSSGIIVHEVHIEYTVRHSTAVLAVEIDTEVHSAFGWYVQAEIMTRIDSPSAKSSIVRAFASLARSRKSM